MPALRAALRRSERRRQISAFLLVSPLLAFLLVTFLLPLAFMLVKGVEDRDFPRAFKETAAVLQTWDGRALPPPAAFAAFARDLAANKGSQSLSFVANRLNFDINGMRSLLLSAARRLAADAPDPQAALLALDPRWGEIETWGAMKRAVGPWSDFFLLSAVDLKRNAAGAIEAVPAERAIFRIVLWRTLWISLLVTAICVLLGYPVAYLLATQPPAVTNLLMILVLLPFWTSVLVRTTAWVGCCRRAAS